MPGAPWRQAVCAYLGVLATAVDGADAAPSPDAVEGFKKIQETLASTLEAWDELKAKDLAVLNVRLKEAGQPVIELAP
jgi:hypothetical protein